MKRVFAGVAAGLLLGLAAVTGAHAVWGDTAALDDGVTVAGDLNVSAAWSPAAPVWSALYPGASTADATLRITGTGVGTTLRWRLSMTSTVAAEFAPYTTFTAWAGPCGTGTPLPDSGYPSAGTLAPGASVDVCVRYTLAPDAPGTLQGRSLTPQIVVTAKQAAG